MINTNIKFIEKNISELKFAPYNPRKILPVNMQVIENAIQISNDIGVTLFYFNRDARPEFFPTHDFIDFCGGFAGGIFGINGRKFRFDTNLTTREDIDFTLQALLKDRIVYTDLRFYFDFGPVWSGEGGNQGIRTSENEEKDRTYLYSKWGTWLNMDMRKRNSMGISNKVTRRSPLATFK